MNNLNLIGVHVANKMDACKFFNVSESDINVSFNETEIGGFKFSTFVYTVNSVNKWCYAVECHNMASDEHETEANEPMPCDDGTTGEMPANFSSCWRNLEHIKNDLNE